MYIVCDIFTLTWTPFHQYCPVIMCCTEEALCTIQKIQNVNQNNVLKLRLNPDQEHYSITSKNSTEYWTLINCCCVTIRATPIPLYYNREYLSLICCPQI